MNCLSRENGDMIRLPCEGGIMDQPATTMAFIEIVQEILIQEIRKDIKEISARVNRI